MKKIKDKIPKGYDYYKKKASDYYQVPMAEITPEQRRFIKTIAFGYLYGR